MQDYKNLPMFKTIDIVEGSSLDKFRKGELPAFKVSKGIVGVGIGLGVIYLMKSFLTGLFIAMGAILGALITGVAIVALIMFLPVVFKGVRLLVRAVHKVFIGYKPFDELYEGVQKMYGNLDLIKNSILKIKQLETTSAKKSQEYEVKAQEYAEQIENSHLQVNKLKEKKEQIVNRLGKDAENDDEYVKYYLAETETLSNVQNVMRYKNQAQDLVIKYGMRHTGMKKTRQKLEKVHSFTKIKISETETSIKVLEIDYQFAKEGASATRAAVEATKGLEGSWTTQYAIEVANNSIAADLQEMSMNLKEIDAIATDFDLDNDAMYDRLVKYTDGMKIKNEFTSDRYLKGNFTPTPQEKTISGLTDMF